MDFAPLIRGICVYYLALHRNCQKVDVGGRWGLDLTMGSDLTMGIALVYTISCLQEALQRGSLPKRLSLAVLHLALRPWLRLTVTDS